ncbi:APC family permease [Aminithiophilus ramosus]|uniref:APC family permease n=1 Tax=Aminithiophilus ramosus TaxID=3029084 RepID=A0A9Q7AE77_9BACT|nr:APC family permease [Aminithiophilus ramosus]QTX31714.1 APC family permease [Aminithiophilus ramosus]
MSGKRRKPLGGEDNVFGFFDMSLFTLCAIVVIDTLPATASVGTSAAGWWIVTALLFFVPYGLVSAELGSAYPEKGGLGGWIARAFGPRWGARVTWLYWAQLALGLPSVYILLSSMTSRMFFPDLPLSGQVALAVGATWITVALSLRPLAQAKEIANAGALAKIAIVAGLLASALFHLFHHPPANDLSWQRLLPTWDGGLAFLPILLFNLAGFELMSGASDEMVDPRRDVPRAILTAGTVITALYLTATLSLQAMIPLEELSLVNGIIDALYRVFGSDGSGTFVADAVGSLVLFSIVATMIGWTLGVNRVAAAAAETGELPALFAKRHNRFGTPLGASLLTALLATALLLLYGRLAETSEELFWTLTAFASILFLLPYVGLFAAFIALRRRDGRAQGGYVIPGPSWLAFLLAFTAALFVVQAILLFLWVPGEPFDGAFALPVVAGVVATVATGERLIGKAEAEGKD